VDISVAVLVPKRSWGNINNIPFCVTMHNMGDRGYSGLLASLTDLVSSFQVEELVFVNLCTVQYIKSYSIGVGFHIYES
jgi:hypothetical protein